MTMETQYKQSKRNKVLVKQTESLKDEVKSIRKEMRRAMDDRSAKKLHKVSRRIVDTLFEIEMCHDIQVECIDKLRSYARAAITH